MTPNIANCYLYSKSSMRALNIGTALVGINTARREKSKTLCEEYYKTGVSVRMRTIGIRNED